MAKTPIAWSWFVVFLLEGSGEKKSFCLDEKFGLERWVFFPSAFQQHHHIWESSLVNYTL